MLRFCRYGLPVSLLSLACSPLALAEEAAGAHELGQITVSATRAHSTVDETPQKVLIISREEIEEQLAISNDPGQVLSNLIPSYSPSRQKLTNSGETFRGRDPLFLVDGIPQSNPLRDGSRDGYTIDPFFIDRVEVIYGSNALQGIGATGGVGYTKSEVEDFNGDVAPISGYSEWVANGTLYYDLNGFSARGSVRYRSEFIGEFSGFGGSPTRRLARAETIVDAQIGYEFQPGSALEGLSVYLQGQNLTNAPFVSQFNVPEPRAVIDYQEYGRRFLVGATFKF